MSCYYVKESVLMVYKEVGFGMPKVEHSILLSAGDVVGIGMTYAMVSFDKLPTDNFGWDVEVENEPAIAEKSVRITSNDYDRFKENHFLILSYNEEIENLKENGGSEEEIGKIKEKINLITAEDDARSKKILGREYKQKSELLKKYDKESALAAKLEKELDTKKEELETLKRHLDKIRHDIKRLVSEEGDTAKIIPHKGYGD